MKLEDYLEKYQMTNREFAERISVHEGTVSHYVQKRRRPEWDVLKRINKATKGKVAPQDFLDDD